MKKQVTHCKFGRLAGLALAVLSLSNGGCSSFDEDVAGPAAGREPGHTEVVFHGDFGSVGQNSGESSDTRTSIAVSDGNVKVEWLEGDEVGIFAKTADASQSNYRYVAVPHSDDATCCDFVVPSESENVLKFYDDVPNGFFAYYPFSGADGEGDAAAFDVSLPAAQVQKSSGDNSHLGEYAVMVADPVEREVGDMSPVSLTFRNVYSVLAVDVECLGVEGTLVSASLFSTENDLAFSAGTMDLTQRVDSGSSVLPLSVTNGSKRINLGFVDNPDMSEGAVSLWFVVLPGSHASGTLSLELVAEDGRTYTYVFDRKVDFVSNRYYHKKLELGADDFRTGDDASGSVISDASYGNVPITGELWTDRTYALLQNDGAVVNLPERFAGWTMATSGCTSYPGGAINPGNPGYVYVMTRATYATIMHVMAKEGWSSVTPLSNDNPSAVRDDSTGNPAMVIWRKYVDAGQSVTIPTTVAGWGGYIPLAPDGFTYDFSDAVVVLHQAVEIGGKTSSKAMADGIVKMENGALFFNNRCVEGGHSLDFAAWNVPAKFTYTDQDRWQTLSYKSAFYPDPSLIEVVESGNVYVMLKNDPTYVSNMEANGWKRETSDNTDLPETFNNRTVETFENDDSYTFYYNGKNVNGASDINGAGYLVIMSRFCTAGEEVDLHYIAKNILKTSAGFQCIRPVCRNLKVVYPSAAVTVVDSDESLDGEVRTFSIGTSLAVGSTGCKLVGEDGSVNNPEWVDFQYYKQNKKGAARVFPAGFAGYDFFAVRRNNTQTSSAIMFRAEETGLVYGLVHAIYGEDMVNAGWTLVSRAYVYDWNYDPFDIYSLPVTAGETYSTPLLTAASGNRLNTVTLLSENIAVDSEQPVISVEGEMVDVRTMKAGEMLYPQNDDYMLSADNIPSALNNLKYATSLKEYGGVARIRADRPTLLKAAVVHGATINDGWKLLGGGFSVGDIDFDTAVYEYLTPGEWVSAPVSAANASTLVFGGEICVEGVPDAPGTLVAKVPVLRSRNIGSPNIMILEDGSYLAGCSGADVSGNTFFRSSDNGRSWQKISNPGFINFSKVFVKDGSLYELGVSKGGFGDLVIRKSVDNGVSWSGVKTLFAGNYHGAPTPFVEHEGRLWHAMGTKNDNEMMGILMMSMPLHSDPMEPSSWTLSNTLLGDNTWLDSTTDHVFNQWQEGCVVKTAENTLKIVTRIDDSRSNNIMALIDVEDEHTISFDPLTGFHIMPGAGKKFTIMYDEPSARYWAVTTPVFDEDRTRRHSGWYSRTILPIFLRSRLALCSSPDLKEWTMEKLVISSNNVFFHGFQYVDWAFDGDDIVAVCRTAFSESRGLPNRQHDANMLTFHRLKDFRNGGFDTCAVEYDQL